MRALGLCQQASGHTLTHEGSPWAKVTFQQARGHTPTHEGSPWAKVTFWLKCQPGHFHIKNRHCHLVWERPTHNSNTPRTVKPCLRGDRTLLCVLRSVLRSTTVRSKHSRKRNIKSGEDNPLSNSYSVKSSFVFLQLRTTDNKWGTC